jgi:hypothetical protein
MPREALVEALTARMERITMVVELVLTAVHNLLAVRMEIAVVVAVKQRDHWV